MIRECDSIQYTDMDKENLVVRVHDPEEVKENKERFSKGQWKRRGIFILIFLALFFLQVIVQSEKTQVVLFFMVLFIVLLGIQAEISSIRRSRKARSVYYVELRIIEKMKTEQYCDRSDGGDFVTFYPVKAVDTSSNYECIYYIDKDEYNTAQLGQTIRVNVFPKELEKRKRRFLPNMYMVIGVMFMLASGMIVPGVTYSLITESYKILYGGISAFVISFFVLGVGLFIGGIKEMKKNKNT